MPVSTSIPRVNFAQAKKALEIALHANVPVLLLGDPGVGKSALAREIADHARKFLATLIGSTLDPTDVGGLPIVRVDGKGVDRVPLAIIQRACDEPCILFLDELSCAAPAVQAAFLRVVLERKVGDRDLHPETRVICAANPPEQAPGGFELSSPLMGRLCVLHLRPEESEVLAFFSGLGAEGSPLRAEAVDFALCATFSERLLQIDIPNGCVSGSVPWGAPRAWERVVRARAAAAELGVADDEVIHALTAGSVGAECAIAYGGILKLRKDLPTVEEIVKDPKIAKVPEEVQKQIASLGLVARVADQNTWAAWIYAERLRPEFGTACAAMLMKRKDSDITKPHAKEGVKARVNLTSRLKRMAS